MSAVKPTMTTTEAAETMNVHPKTVEDLIHAGVLPAGKVGRAWVLKTSDVLKHVDQEIQRQTADRLRKMARRQPAPANWRARQAAARLSEWLGHAKQRMTHENDHFG